MQFAGFKGALEFLQQVRTNNNKEWFEANRSRYEKLILSPSKEFVIEMGEHLMALNPSVKYEPKINKSLFKIFRDTRRMGANKEPIKSKIGIIFPQGGWEDRIQKSSFYMHFSPDELFVAVGTRWFYKPMLDAYRKYILDENRRLDLAAVLEKIRSNGYKIVDKEYKKYPRGFTAEMKECELSLYKGMATYKTLDPILIEDGKMLIETLYKCYEEMFPLQQIVYKISLMKS